MDVTPIVNRLKDNLAGYVQIYGLAEFDPSRMNTERVPAIWIVPENEGWRDDGYTTEITEAYTLYLATRNVSDRHGKASLDDLMPLREQVKGLLHLFEIDSGELNFTNGTGRGFDEDYTLWWIDTYEFTYTARSCAEG